MLFRSRNRDERLILVNQTAYIDRKLAQFRMSDAITAATPIDSNTVYRTNDDFTITEFPYREAVGSLVYLATQTRPDIIYAVSVLSRYASNPSQAHINAVRRVFRYLLGTRQRGIILGGKGGICAFSDSDWAGDVDTRRSTTGFIISCGGPIVWHSRLQTTVALSTCEAEYIALSECSRVLLWIRNILIEIRLVEPDVLIPLYCDNRSAVAQLVHDSISARVRHVDIKYHFVRSLARDNILSVEWIQSANQRADGLTKALNSVAFGRFLDQLDGLYFCSEGGNVGEIM